tara:strand:- start:12998 stop:15283 length:2286 start_codon:yes stop_codon:yes gene_type:complete
MKNKDFYGFPNPLASREEKLTKEYGLQYFKQMFREWEDEGSGVNLMSTRNQRYRRYREYAEGMQSIDQYKELVGANGDSSYLNLNWEVVPIIPKFVDVLVGGLTNQDYNIRCTAIDPVSVDKKHQDTYKALAKIELRSFATEVAGMTGLPLDKEFQDLPENKEELELYMELNYKQAVEIGMEQGIELTFYLNDWEEIRKRVVRDLTVLDIGVTKTGVENGKIIIRYVDPVNFVSSHSSSPDFKNMEYAGEVMYITIHDLKRMAGDQFTDEEYEDIAKSVLGRHGNPAKMSLSTVNYNGYEVTEYDTYKISLIDGVFKCTDSLKYEKKNNKYGGYSFNKKDSKYKPPKNPRYKRTQINSHVEMIYKGKYIIGTDYIFDYGVADNIVRPKSNLSKALMPFSVYAPNILNMNNKGMVERMIPFADQIQLAHLKIQHLISKVKPQGSAIELGAIENVGKGDGGTFTPLEVQDIYQQTGNLYYRLQQDDGTPGPANPIQELRGGIGGALQELIAIYQYNLQMIRDVTGINEARDASQPDKESLVGVQKMALLASNNATRWLNQAFLSITRNTAKSIALRVQDLVKYSGTYKGYVQSIGEYNMKAIEVTKDVTLADFGIMIEPLPDEEQKQLLEQNIQVSIQQGELRIEDAILIRSIPNIKLANQMLILRRKKYAEEQQEMAMANAKANAEQQQVSIQAKAQADSQLKMQDVQADIEKLKAEYELRETFAQAEHERKLRELEVQGEIKGEHIGLAQDDSDLVRTKVK